jgi:hypothetical protein
MLNQPPVTQITKFRSFMKTNTIDHVLKMLLIIGLVYFLILATIFVNSSNVGRYESLQGSPFTILDTKTGKVYQKGKDNLIMVLEKSDADDLTKK